ncbi:hypothetical protein J6590_083337 [Homalodisca vitripennis]|nr:hypothetical protein J6590_083337 [Homalodisca vitripennis]
MNEGDDENEVVDRHPHGNVSVSDAESEHSNHDTASDQTGDEEGIESMDIDNVDLGHQEPTEPQPALQINQRQNVTVGHTVGKDGITSWHNHKPTSATTRTIRQNVVTKLPGTKGLAKNSKSVLDSWRLFSPMT